MTIRKMKMNIEKVNIKRISFNVKVAPFKARVRIFFPQPNVQDDGLNAEERVQEFPRFLPGKFAEEPETGICKAIEI
jgi:hypothetical protein